MHLPDVSFFSWRIGNLSWQSATFAFRKINSAAANEIKKNDFVAAAEMEALNCKNSARLKGSFFGEMLKPTF